VALHRGKGTKKEKENSREERGKKRREERGWHVGRGYVLL